ncbi:phage protein [Gluconobacter frateurii M-2]|nr:phage protein [Gluconobacter frateurii M-2]
MMRPLPPMLIFTRTQKAFDHFLSQHIEPEAHNQARDIQVRLQHCRNLAASSERDGDKRMAMIWDESAFSLENELQRLLTANRLPEDVLEIPEPPARAVRVDAHAELDRSQRLNAWCAKQVANLRAITMGSSIRRYP